MGHQVIKQPNGLFALYSSTTDEIFAVNLTPQQIVEIWSEAETSRTARDLRRILGKIEAGEKPYYQFTVTRAEALRKTAEPRRDIAKRLMSTPVPPEKLKEVQDFMPEPEEVTQTQELLIYDGLTQDFV